MTDNSQHQHEHITNQDPQSKEELLFDEVGIFYNFVFDLGDFINPTIAARKLLERISKNLINGKVYIL